MAQMPLHFLVEAAAVVLIMLTQLQPLVAMAAVDSQLLDGQAQYH
jgi:hypothetical protein